MYTTSTCVQKGLAGKACETQRKANAKSTFDQIDIANIAMFVNAINPVCLGNSGNETYDTSGLKNIVKLALECRHDVFVSFSLS